MAVIMTSYYLLYFPAFINAYFEYDAKLESYLGYILFYLWTCNGFVNPIIYYLTNKDFKIAFHAILKIKSRTQLDSNLGEASVTQTPHLS